MGKGREHNLPSEVFAALPKDPDQQLEVAQQITHFAVSGRVAKLEAETSSLRQKVAEKEQIIGGLQARVIGAETILQETAAKLALALEGQAKLIDEKNILAGQVKKLMCQVSKLDSFKCALMKSLEASAECGEANEGDKSPCPPLTKPAPCGSLPSSPCSKSTVPPTPIKRNQQGPFSCMKQPCPESRPKSPTSDKSVGSEDEGTMFKQSPLGPLTPRSPSDTRSPAQSPRIDGKEFFRQARNRLSYGQFSEFLTNIKELNAHRQTREETRKKSDEIFGKENFDLSEAFQGLLSRYLTPMPASPATSDSPASPPCPPPPV